jgi:hypothetical protein
MLFNPCKGCGDPIPEGLKYCDVPNKRCYSAYENAQGRKRHAKFSPERKRASNLVWTEIFSGRLIRQPCEVCGRSQVVAHHDDYAKPLEVRWLCISHHRLHHVKFGPGKNAFAAEEIA